VTFGGPSAQVSAVIDAASCRAQDVSGNRQSAADTRVEDACSSPNGTFLRSKFRFLKEQAAIGRLDEIMERAFPILNTKRSREVWEAGLRTHFPACHDHSSRIDELLLQLQRRELDQQPEPGVSVLSAGS